MKKGIKIILIVLGVLVGIIALDTLQAKIFNNNPIIHIRKYYDKNGEINYIDKGIIVDTYCYNTSNKKTIFKWEPRLYNENLEDNQDLNSTIKDNNEKLLNCLKSQVEAYITSEKIIPKEEKLENLIEYDKNNLEYSYVMKSKIGIYVILKTTDDKIINELDKYFNKKYKGYQTATNNDYKIYVYNNLNDFDLENDLATCYKD